MKVVFFGTPRFAVPSLERLLPGPHPVVGVVTQPDRPRGRGQKPSDAPVKVVALREGLPLLQPDRLKDDGFLGAFAALGADIGVVAAYGKILPEAVLAIPRLGLVNVHASLLPRYRGAAPIQRAVLAGERETGVSIMRVVRALDAGPVFATRATAIGPSETADRVEQRLADLGADLLLEVLGEIEGGRARETPQDERNVTYAPRLTKEEGLIDWTAPAWAIHNAVRGLHPWPHAFTYLGRVRLIVLESAVGGDAATALVPSGGCPAPGEILEAARDTLGVAAGGGTRLDLLRIQPEGRKPMCIREFLAGHPLSPGMIFGPG
jgi:methionyl-tRNA formyltransferase